MNSAIRTQNFISHLPPLVQVAVNDMISHTNVELKIVPKRKTLLGTYIPPQNGKSQRITINSDMNTYQFLVTFLHEWAHLLQWQQNKRVGHTKEWKQCFATLLTQYVGMDVFPSDLAQALLSYSKHVKYAEFTDVNLSRLFQKYNAMEQKKQSTIFLSDIPEKTVFLHNGILMQKQKLLRKYFICKNLKNNKLYKCHPLMEVVLI